jgi:hypothetical protein
MNTSGMNEETKKKNIYNFNSFYFLENMAVKIFGTLENINCKNVHLVT